ncbi:MAG: hypothetical protein AAFR64_02655 [Pseudomonadota bacterium]
MMMSEASFASLGPTLLARKGGAKPAMRPQLTPLPDNISELAALAEEQLEDLGWNDMGSEEPANDAEDGPLLSSKRGHTPSPLGAEIDETAELPAEADAEENTAEENTAEDQGIVDPLADADVVSISTHPSVTPPANEDSFAGESPLVMSHQKRLARRVLDDAEVSVVSKKPNKTKAKLESSAKAANARRAAFTLRLDTERHLKLRLAATMQGVSAQSLVTEALDALLEDIEELDTLIDRMKRD